MVKDEFYEPELDDWIGMSLNGEAGMAVLE